MKARTVKLSLLVATFALVASDYAKAVPISVNINTTDPSFLAKLNDIRINSDVKKYRNDLRIVIAGQQAAAKPLEPIIDPILTSAIKTQVKKDVMNTLRGTLILGPIPTVNPLGEVPNVIVPTFAP